MSVASHSKMLNFSLMYVTGKCMHYPGKPSGDLNNSQVMDFISRTHTVAWKYCRDQLTLNGSVSDFECHVAMELKTMMRDQWAILNKEC